MALDRVSVIEVYLYTDDEDEQAPFTLQVYGLTLWELFDGYGDKLQKILKRRGLEAYKASKLLSRELYFHAQWPARRRTIIAPPPPIEPLTRPLPRPPVPEPMIKRRIYAKRKKEKG